MKRKAITDGMKYRALKQSGVQPRCYKCLAAFFLSNLQFDHIQALVDGGKHEPENIRPICFRCHREKSAFEHKRNSKSKRLARAKEAHAAIVAKVEEKKPGKIKSRPFPKLPKQLGVVR